MMMFKELDSADATLDEIGSAHMIRNRQFRFERLTEFQTLPNLRGNHNKRRANLKPNRRTSTYPMYNCITSKKLTFEHRVKTSLHK